MRPSCASESLEKQRALGQAGCPPHPRPIYIGRKHTVVATCVAGIIRPSLRNGFNGLFRALPGDRPLLPPSFAGYPCDLSAGVGGPGPHDFAVRETPFEKAIQMPLPIAKTSNKVPHQPSREAKDKASDGAERGAGEAVTPAPIASSTHPGARA